MLPSAIALPILILAEFVLRDFPVTYSILILVVFVLLAASVIYKHSDHDIFHPLILLTGLFGYFVIVPGMYIALTGEFSSLYTAGYPALAGALTVLLAAYLVILGAFYFTSRVLESYYGSDSFRYLDHTWHFYLGGRLNHMGHFRVLTVLGVVGVLLGVVFYEYYVVVNGGHLRLLTVQPRTTFQQEPNMARYRWLAQAGLFGGAATVLLGQRPQLESGNIGIREIVVAGVPVTLAVAAAISFRARGLVLVLGIYLVIYIYTTGRTADRTVALTAAVVIAVGGAFSAVEIALIGSGPGGSGGSLIEGFVHTARLNVFIGIVTLVPSEYPYQFGSTLVGALPIETGVGSYGEQAALLLGAKADGVTLSGMLPGELWLNAGLMGVVGGAAVYGVALRIIYTLRGRASYVVRGIYPVILTSVLLIWTTNVLWATKTLGLQLVMPVVASLAVIYIVSLAENRHTEAR